MNPLAPSSWIQDQEPEEPEPVVLTAAETAECCCPDPCECDHDN
jgi:hypothetical protein